MLHLEKKYLLCWCVCYCEWTLKHFNDTFHTHAMSHQLIDKFLASSSFRRKHAPPSDLLKLFTNTKGTFETRHSFQKKKKAQGVRTTTKMRGSIPTGPLSPRRPATLHFHLLLPLTQSLSFAVTARPRRGTPTIPYNCAYDREWHVLFLSQTLDASPHVPHRCAAQKRVQFSLLLAEVPEPLLGATPLGSMSASTAASTHPDLESCSN